MTRAAEWVSVGSALGRVALKGGNLAFASMLLRPRRAFQYLASSLFLHRLASGDGLEQRKPHEILGTNGNANIALSLDQESWFHSWDPSFGIDLFWLCTITQMTRPNTVFEIGTSRGVSALHFALNSHDQAHIYTLDLPKDGSTDPKLPTTVIDRDQIREGTVFRPVFTKKPEAGKITQLFGDSAIFNFSQYHGRVDLFFVDGAHSYDYVKSDTERALRCCHRGSVLLWHDYGRYGVNGVTRYLHELNRRRNIYRLPGSAVAIHIIE